MGLRFRKSVTICKGVRLNFGKTGTSVSVGGKGYRKTFHSSGRVTTSVGIPGTGIYWTDSKNVGKKKPVSSVQNVGVTQSSNVGGSRVRDYSLDRTIPAEGVNYDPIWLTETQDEEKISQSFETNDSFSMTGKAYGYHMEANNVMNLEANHENTEDGKKYLTEKYIRNIYQKCDECIDWGEILAGASADELMMDKAFWMECKKHCAKIMRGDVDTYLEVIEIFRPVDDILTYAGEFEFGTDSSNYIETEFRVQPDEILEGGIKSSLFEEFIYSIAIRVARDLMALLPIKKVIMHVVCDGITFFSSIMDKGKFAECDFKNASLMEIVSCLDFESGIDSHQIREVNRKILL